MGNMAQVINDVMGNQRDAMMEGFSALADSLRGGGQGGGKGFGTRNSTIKVEPKMPWPEFGDRHKDPQEAEDFIRAFESICRMANNGHGMRPEEMVYTIGNCLKGNRKLLFDNIMIDASDDGTMITNPQSVYDKIRSRLLQFTETMGEKQIRVRAEWEELEKTKSETLLDFEARWEKAHRNIWVSSLVC